MINTDCYLKINKCGYYFICLDDQYKRKRLKIKKKT